MTDYRVLDRAWLVRLAICNHEPYALRKTVRAGRFGGEDDRQLTALPWRVFGLRIASEWVPRPLHHAALRTALLEPGSRAGSYR